MSKKITEHIRLFIQRCKDVRFLGQLGFLVLVLMLSWSTVKSIQTNYDLQRQIAEAEQVNALHKIKNDNLRLENKYLETDEYLELAARRQFGKAAPGEMIIVIPKSVAYANTKEFEASNRAVAEKKADEQKPFYQRNLEAWGRFFFPPR